MDPHYDLVALNARAAARYPVPPHPHPQHQPLVAIVYDPNHHHHRRPQFPPPPPPQPHHYRNQDTRIYYPSSHEYRAFDSEISAGGGIYMATNDNHHSNKRIRYSNDSIPEEEFELRHRRRIDPYYHLGPEFSQPSAIPPPPAYSSFESKRKFDFDGRQGGIEQEYIVGSNSNSSYKGKRKVFNGRNGYHAKKSSWKPPRMHSGKSVWDRIEEKLPPLPPREKSLQMSEKQQPEMDRLDLEYKPTGLVAKVVMPPGSSVETNADVKQMASEEVAQKKVVKKKVLKKRGKFVVSIVPGPECRDKKIVKKPKTDTAEKKKAEASSSMVKIPAKKEAIALVKSGSSESSKNVRKTAGSIKSSSNEVPKKVAREVSLEQSGSTTEGSKKEGKAVVSAKNGSTELGNKERKEVTVKKVVQKSASAQLPQKKDQNAKKCVLDKRIRGLVAEKASLEKSGSKELKRNDVPEVLKNSEIPRKKVQDSKLLDATSVIECSSPLCSSREGLRSGSLINSNPDCSGEATPLISSIFASSKQVCTVAEDVERHVENHNEVNDSCPKDSPSVLNCNGIVTTLTAFSTPFGVTASSRDVIIQAERSIEEKQQLLQTDGAVDEIESQQQLYTEVATNRIETPNCVRSTTEDELLHSSPQDDEKRSIKENQQQLRTEVAKDQMETPNDGKSTSYNEHPHSFLRNDLQQQEDVNLRQEKFIEKNQQKLYTELVMCQIESANVGRSTSDNELQHYSLQDANMLQLEDIDVHQERSIEETQQLYMDVDMNQIEADNGGRSTSEDEPSSSSMHDVTADLPIGDQISDSSMQSRSVDGDVECTSLPIRRSSTSDLSRLVEGGLVVKEADALNMTLENPLLPQIAEMDPINVTPMVQDAVNFVVADVNLQTSDAATSLDDNHKNDKFKTNQDASPLLPQINSVSKTGQGIRECKSIKNSQQAFSKLLPLLNSKGHVTKTLTGLATSSTSIIKAGASGSFPNRRSSISSKGGTSTSHAVRHRTWRRSDSGVSAPPTLVRQSPKKSKPPSTSYIRKGNSLIRKSPGQVSAPQLSHGLPASSSISKVVTNELKHKSEHNNHMNCSNPYSERPKTPPLPVNSKLLKHNLSSERPVRTHLPVNSKLLNPTTKPVQDGSRSMSEDSQPSIEVQDGISESPSVSLLLVNGDEQNATSSRNSDLLNMRMVYVKHKSNLLVAAHGRESSDSVHTSDQAQIISSNTFEDMYYRRKKNQLVRNGLSDGQQKQDLVTLADTSNTDAKVSNIFPHKNQTTDVCARRVHKVMLKARKHSKFSHVWTLDDDSNRKTDAVSFRSKILPSLFPWKRTPILKSSALNSNTPSLSAFSQKLQVTRKRNTIYKVSADGFSLRKARVLSIGGASLKWSKSIEKRSQKANEEATMAVAEVERKKRERKKRTASAANKNNENHLLREQIFRIGSARYKMDSSRRTLIRIPDDQLSSEENQQSERTTQKPFVPKRLLIGNEEYVRVGNGNKLVRDPKKLKRILASEKVRWSLHNVRLRLARKQQYCQFFTRFGKCDKNEGKCPYIHDPSKVAICTKYLRGVCSDSDCKLTHQIIPERMPDCSYFLQGICTNTNCSYRHVKVNSKASVCEGFLRGYCADGDECNKKHTYVCPDFETTGKCSRGSKCKLHHPKNKKKNKKRKRIMVQENVRGRYFGSNSVEGSSRPLITTSDNGGTENNSKNSFFSDGQSSNYISLEMQDSDDSDCFQEEPGLNRQDSHFCRSLQPDELDALIKPVKIMNKQWLEKYGFCTQITAKQFLMPKVY